MRNKDDPTQPHITYQKNKKAVEKHADPKTFAEQIATHSQEYAKAAPTITQGINASLMRAQQFMQSKLPQPVNSFPLSMEHKPSRSAMSKFNQYAETVSDPISVFDHVKKGTLRNEHLEVLQTVYPKLYDEMKKKLTEHMDPEKAKDLPYGTKVAIAKFMGQPMDASMTPQAIMQNQAALTGPRLGSQGAVKSTRSTLGGLKELSADKRASTETDRIEDEQ